MIGCWYAISTWEKALIKLTGFVLFAVLRVWLMFSLVLTHCPFAVVPLDSRNDSLIEDQALRCYRSPGTALRGESDHDGDRFER